MKLVSEIQAAQARYTLSVGLVQKIGQVSGGPHIPDSPAPVVSHVPGYSRGLDGINQLREKSEKTPQGFTGFCEA